MLTCERCGNRRPPESRFCQRCGAAFAAPQGDPMLGETLLGRYRVVSLLGQGTMGKVYLGEQRVGEATRRVAIKVLASARGNDDYIVARFRREASTIASLEHPNIIRLYDYGEEGGRFLSVMEYVPGGSLATLMARGPVAPSRVEAIAAQIASALDAAHRSGVVHRDLKPENVLLASTADTPGAADVVKVVDFGIARRPPGSPGERPLTVTGAMLGTPAYMSPEQFMGEAADARSDVYALAIVVYQMLSGALPWTAESVMEWGEAQLHRAPRPLRSQPGCAGLPERYDAAIAHALAKDARRRTASTLEFVRELTGDAGASAGPVPGAAPPAPVADVDAIVRPSRGPVVVVVLVVIASLAAVAGVGWYLVRDAIEAPSNPDGAVADAALPAAPKPDAAAPAIAPATVRDASAPRAAPARRSRPTASGSGRARSTHSR